MSAIWRGRAAGPFYALAFAALCVACLHWSRDHAVPIALGVLVWFLVNALSDALSGLPLIGRLIAWVLPFASVVLWVTLMVQSFRGERIKLPFVGDWAEERANAERI